ncbi:hypothetical protein [Natroniella sp. ANB-PHB2]
MEEFLSGIVLIGFVGAVFYLLAKKLKVTEKDHNQDNDDFSCH